MDFDLSDYLFENYVEEANRTSLDQFVPFFDCVNVTFASGFHKKGFLLNKNFYESNDHEFKEHIIFGRKYHKHLLSEIDVLKGLCMKSR